APGLAAAADPLVALLGVVAHARRAAFVLAARAVVHARVADGRRISGSPRVVVAGDSVVVGVLAKSASERHEAGERERTETSRTPSSDAQHRPRWPHNPGNLAENGAAFDTYRNVGEQSDGRAACARTTVDGVEGPMSEHVRGSVAEPSTSPPRRRLAVARGLALAVATWSCA